MTTTTTTTTTTDTTTTTTTITTITATTATTTATTIANTHTPAHEVDARLVADVVFGGRLVVVNEGADVDDAHLDGGKGLEGLDVPGGRQQ